MANRNIPCYGWAISFEELRKICPEELEAITSKLQNEDTNWPDLLFDTDEDLRITLEKSFNEKTGLELHCDPDVQEAEELAGSMIHDDQIIFVVHGMEEIKLTPAGEKFKDIIKWHDWVIFA